MNHLRPVPLFFIFILFFWTLPAWSATEILNLRHWAAPEHTRVVVDTSEEIRFTTEKSPSKVQLTLDNSSLLKKMPREYILNEPGISRIILTPLEKGNVRIELFVTENVETNIFKLKKFQDKPHRLVVDITLPEVEKEKSLEREKVKVVKKDKIIVIDPGHGGEDPGAMGRLGTVEKSVVLMMGKKLRDLLNTNQGTHAFLTREGDYYVPFKKRLSIAREFGADLFISIHADAARNKAANGSSVYCLSTGGASSEAAKILARKENMADIIGGTLGEGKSGDESDPIILSMFQTNTINQSKTFGSEVLNGLCRVNDIKFSRVQEAPFRVLKLPEIPAILIETAYITNPQEELHLRDDKFQESMARSIAGSVREFFSLPELPIPEMATAKDKMKEAIKSHASEKQPSLSPTYTVKKGDTLAKIARQYHTQLGTLLKLNKMKMQDPLYVGRTISVNVSEESLAARKDPGKSAVATKTAPERISTPRVYKVKKGDTIVKIARRYQTPISAILKLNRMKLHDPLYVDRELKLPRSQS